MKLKPLAMAALVLVSVSARAEFVETAPTDPTTQIHTVQAAQNMRDGNHVILEGRITGKAGTLNPEEFFFQDATGSLKVEIDGDVWRGQQVSPQTPIRIWGKVDQNPVNKTMEIEVDKLEIIR